MADIIKQIRTGLYILKQPKSPYWYVRCWNPVTKKYVKRSTKERSRIEAIEAAKEFADNFDWKAEAAKAKTVTQTSFEHFARKLPVNDKTKEDWKKLNRPDDGILAYFGPTPVTQINTGMLRDYINEVNNNRDEPLAVTTQKKHLYSIRKVLTVAVEEGVLATLPVSPKLEKVEDKPRPSFNDAEYKKFFDVLNKQYGTKVKGEAISEEHTHLFRFMKYSFLRPTTGELFGIRHRDIRILSNPARLEITVYQGKTGKRLISTMPLAEPIYKNMKKLHPDAQPDDFVFFPETKNRQTALRKVGDIFAHVADKAKLRYDGAGVKRSVYSFRHHCIQSRIIESKGEVNLLSLAKMCGTSLEVIDRFYARKLPLTGEMLSNLQTYGK